MGLARRYGSEECWVVPMQPSVSQDAEAVPFVVEWLTVEHWLKPLYDRACGERFQFFHFLCPCQTVDAPQRMECHECAQGLDSGDPRPTPTISASAAGAESSAASANRVTKSPGGSRTILFHVKSPPIRTQLWATRGDPIYPTPVDVLKRGRAQVQVCPCCRSHHRDGMFHRTSKEACREGSQGSRQSKGRVGHCRGTVGFGRAVVARRGKPFSRSATVSRWGCPESTHQQSLSWQGRRPLHAKRVVQ